MFFKRKRKKPLSKTNLLVLTACVAICGVLVLSWIVIKELHQPSGKTAFENSENVVINNVGASHELVSALLAEKAGCPSEKNIVYIERELDRFALVRYGCNLDAMMFYKHDGSTWIAINPTNKFFNDIPVCSMLKEHGIPSKVQLLCYDGVPDASGKLPEIKQNPVN